jgi:hypothetical protein
MATRVELYVFDQPYDHQSDIALEGLKSVAEYFLAMKAQFFVSRHSRTLWCEYRVCVDHRSTHTEKTHTENERFASLFAENLAGGEYASKAGYSDCRRPSEVGES